MNWQIYQILVNAIGVPAIVASLIYIGAKLQVLNDLKTTTETIKHNVKVIADFLTQNTAFDAGELKNYSPLSLTFKGNALIKQLNFDSVLAAHKEDFFRVIDEDRPKLKYDVNLAAVRALYALADKQYMDFLKIYFYNNPSRNMSNTAPTLGVYIRDQYLQEHSEIVK